jgi:hypothetical protein
VLDRVADEEATNSASAVTFARSGQTLDIDNLVALEAAVDALLSSSRVVQARLMARKLRSALEDAQAPRTRAFGLRAQRSTRS